MASSKERKIVFNYLQSTQENHNTYDSFVELVKCISEKEKINRKYEINKIKFALIDSITFDKRNQIYNIVFKSASTDSRPPLIDKQTIKERENPKTLEEGDANKTHVCCKKKNNSVLFLIEKHTKGVSEKQIIDYFNYFAAPLANVCRYRFDKVVKPDFLKELKSMSRVAEIQFKVQKQILGSLAMNTNNRLMNVDENVVIKAVAERNKSIQHLGEHIYKLATQKEPKVTQVVITGKKGDRLVKLNTEAIEKEEWINVEYDSATGQVSTLDILNKMKQIFKK